MSCFNLTKELTATLEPFLGERGFELTDLDWRPEQNGWTLRVYMDCRQRPVTLKDCELMSATIGAHLDRLDIIHHSYNLEVSSPGLYRSLKKERDFSRFVGQRARIELNEPVAQTGQKVFAAVIDSVEGAAIVFSQGKERFRVALENIAKANLDPIVNI